jgi:hypothetical protein
LTGGARETKDELVLAKKSVIVIAAELHWD